MSGSKKPRKSDHEKGLRRFSRSGVDGSQWLRPSRDGDPANLSDRLRELLKTFDLLTKTKKPGDVLCIISYDIESNKVRTRVAKYLIKKGCRRLQKSVYFAHLDRKVYHDIVTRLREIQAMYENDDSIFFLPIGEDQLNSMELVGRDLHYQLRVKKRSTLFI